MLNKIPQEDIIGDIQLELQQQQKEEAQANLNDKSN